MASVHQARATLDDLYRTPEKAELIGGRIVRFMASGYKPSSVAFQVAISLREHTIKTGLGKAFADNTRFAIPELPSGRESFSPDASFYDGPLPADPMRFIEGPPTLAVEVRSKNDYGAAAEIEMADKRANYFAAGTQVVWDVDPRADCIYVYKASSPNQPVTYSRDQTAEAEPAVHGWRVAVDWIFS
jgi:Uma2 family endonuclease